MSTNDRKPQRFKERGLKVNPFSLITDDLLWSVLQDVYAKDEKLESLAKSKKSVVFLSPYSDGKVLDFFCSERLIENSPNILTVTYNEFGTVRGHAHQIELREHELSLFGAIAEAVWNVTRTQSHIPCWWWEFLHQFLLDDLLPSRMEIVSPKLQDSYKNCMPTKKAVFAESISLPYKLQDIRAHLSDLNLNHLQILLDNFAEVENKVEEDIKSLIRPFLYTPELYHEFVTWQIFLPDSLAPFVHMSPIFRRKHIQTADLSWNRQSLKALLEEIFAQASLDHSRTRPLNFTHFSKQVPYSNQEAPKSDLDEFFINFILNNHTQFDNVLVAFREVGSALIEKILESEEDFSRKHFWSFWQEYSVQERALDNQKKLKAVLNEYFNKNEIAVEVLDPLYLDLDTFKDGSKSFLIVELIKYTKRHNCYQELVEIVAKARPSLGLQEGRDE